jgi:hypothetical protein
MIEISVEQAELLDRMANTKHKTFGTYRSVSEVYDSVMELVEWGLCEDLTHKEDYAEVRKKILEGEGEELHVVGISKMGKLMFHRQFSRRIQ